ncbi:MAG: hypothetical protein ACQEUM_04365 [Pseudomonadota bacterium]
MSCITLLEPYRSALVSEAFDHGLAEMSSMDYRKTLGYVDKDSYLRRSVLELSMFYDTLTLSHFESTPDVKEKADMLGFPVLSLEKLRGEGLVFLPEIEGNDFLNRYQESVEKYRESEFWKVNKDLIDTWRALIASQLVSRGKLAHPSLFDVIYSKRVLSEKDFVQSAKEVSEDSRAWIKRLDDDELMANYDKLVAITLEEILITDEIVSNYGANVAIDENFCFGGVRVEKNNAESVLKVLIEKLLEDELKLPVPSNILQLYKLRESEGMRSFRGVFNPWLIKLSTGDEGEEVRLRREVKQSLKQFRNYPRLQRASNLVGLMAAPAGVLGEYGWVAGAALRLTSKGMDKLANRWVSRTKWVAMCAQ